MIEEGLGTVARFGGKAQGPQEGQLPFRPLKEVVVNGAFDPAIYRVEPG